MGLHTVLSDEIREVDVIIAGGGTTGCILASRLSDADPDLSVLVIEYGRTNQGNQLTVHPLLWRVNLQPQSGTCMYYIGQNESQLLGRGIPVATGGILGGGSSINLSIYTRPQATDYNAWKTKGWSADDLWPFIKKFEAYRGAGDMKHHGVNGPIEITSGPYRQLETERDFIAAMAQVGYPEAQDLQDFYSNNGAAHCLKYVSADGKRQDTAHAYLLPRLQDKNHGNLHVLVESQVNKVIFDQESRRAVGVEYRPNPIFQKDDKQQGLRRVGARKLVVLCCGTLGNPGILERSGVGDPNILDQAGIPVVADVPGVGDGYQDHQVVSYHYKSSIPKEQTSDAAFNNLPASVSKLLESQDIILGWNGFDASAKIKPTEDEVNMLGDAFRRAWDQDYRDFPEKPLSTMILSTGLLGNPRTLPQDSYTSLGLYNSYPYSRGHVHITGAGLDDRLDFRTGFLTDDGDVDLTTHILAYKKQREVARRMKTFRGEVEGHIPSFPPGSKAAVAAPVRDGANDMIEYSAEDDVAIAEWIRKNVTTCWHGLGTCKMGPRDRENNSVVDENLSVYGVQALKVADLSIAPSNVSANTNNTALTIAEKAADIIIRELDLSHE
ncbi:alcohol oxidase-like protein [Xylariomycetidae sp. FL2044]|nr:alcohol oxidase-like protein [Xylariomycetidae sp. FL2044]